MDDWALPTENLPRMHQEDAGKVSQQAVNGLSSVGILILPVHKAIGVAGNSMSIMLQDEH